VERKHGIIGAQEQGVSVAAREKFYLRISLTLILLECEWESGITGLNSTALSGRDRL
jgi:hypothetical protein